MNKLFLFLFSMLLLAGCKDEPEHDFRVSGDASFMFGPDEWSNWMDFSAPKNSHPEVSVEMAVNPNEKWLSAFCDYKFESWRVNVRVQDNPNRFKRWGFVTITLGKSSRKIYVEQGANETAVFETERQILRNTAGEFTVRFKTAGKPSAVVRMTDPWNTSSLGYERWISTGEIKEVAANTYEATVSYKANDGFGRVAQFVVDTKNSRSGLTIIQLPKVFEESETVVTDYWGGSLPLMFGYVPGSMWDYDMDNISRIRHLTIKGGINCVDLDVLRMLTKSERRPISLDLGESWFVASNHPQDPYESFGYKDPKPEFGIIVTDDGIPSQLFQTCMGLDSIVLPSRTVEIKSDAFRSTRLLQSIDIPASVRAIGDWAFSGSRITAINIDKSSQLETLGDYVFHTRDKIVLESLYLPSTVENVTDKTFSLMKVKRLYLDMKEPPAWNLKKAVIDTLFLPDASLIDAYRAAPGWGDIPEIRAWPEGWKETPWHTEE